MGDPAASDQLVVGFDLDMTLVDPRPGVVATFAALAAEFGIEVDGELAASRLGPPLEIELAHWVEPERIPELAAWYRSQFAETGVAGTKVLPGAPQSLAAVRGYGGQVVVVSAKSQRGVDRTLEVLGLDVDVAVGDLWAEGKGALLAQYAADVYVGDHVGDVRAAKAGGATSVAVLGTSCTEAELRDAGADAVLATLEEFPAWLASYVVDRRLAALESELRGLGGVLVAFSGGTDSAFLLAAAVRALGAENIVAATAISPSLPADELTSATAFAASLGVRHLTPTTDELSREGYVANAGDRCFFCKAELLDVLASLAAETGMAYVATGTNADDALAGFRPGIRAAHERGAVTPLKNAGLTKAQIREASRRWRLATWDKPAAACLSSRIAYGVEVTAARLSRVERAETALRVGLAGAGLGVRDLRVRDLGDRAVVEVDADLVAAVRERPEVLAVIEGFDVVELDPLGFRSGSMNERLTDADRWR